VTRKSDSEADAQRRRRDLSAWFTRAIEAKEALGWSRTRIAMKAGLNRKDLYRWLDPEEIPKSPRSATIRRICDGLNLDYSEPARIMGWDLLESGPSGGAPTALEGKIARARALLRTNLSPAQRAEYEKMLAGYERVYERMLDDFFEQIEADIAQSRESEREQ
jgi:DNA-binding phage protein